MSALTSWWPSSPTSRRPPSGSLPRGTLHFEGTAHYDGGPDGATLLRRVLREAPDFLRPGGVLLLELGGEQAELLRPELEQLGYRSVDTWTDDDGDVRGLEARNDGG